MAAEASFVIRAIDATRAGFASVQNALQKTAAIAKTTAQSINSALGGFGIALGTGAVISFGKSVIDLGGYINDTARASGLSTDAFQALAYAAQESGVGMEQMARAAEALRTKISDAAAGNEEAEKIFRKLGLTGHELKAISLDKAFEVIAKAIKSAKDEQEAMNIASDIFGARIGPRLREVIDTLAQGSIEKLKEQMKGVTLTQDQLNALDSAGDKLERIYTQLKVIAAQGFLGMLNAMTKMPLALGYATAIVTRPKGGDLSNKVDETTSKIQANTTATTNQVAAIDAATQATMDRALAEARLLAEMHGGKNDPARRTAALVKGLEMQEEAFNKMIDRQKKANDETQKNRDEAKRLSDQVEDQAESYRKIGDPLRVFALQLRDINKLEKDAALTVAEASAARTQVIKNLEEFKLKNDELAKSAKMVGDAFASSFEDAIFSGDKLSDVLKNLARDLIRIVFQQTITAPLAGAISSFIRAGFRAEGGPVSSGMPYVVGEKGPELFVPRTSGSIISNHAMGGGSGYGGVNITYNIAAGVTQAELTPILEAERRRLKAEIPDMVRRGGAYRAAFA